MFKTFLGTNKLAIIIYTLGLVWQEIKTWVKSVCGRLSRQAEFILQGSKSQTISRKSRDKAGVSICQRVHINFKCLKEK